MNRPEVDIHPAVQAAIDTIAAAGLSCVVAYVGEDRDGIVTCAGGPDPDAWYRIGALVEIAINRDTTEFPGICSTCGCTYQHACLHDNGEPCHWANKKRTLCSRCDEFLTHWRQLALDAVKEAEAEHANRN